MASTSLILTALLVMLAGGITSPLWLPDLGDDPPPDVGTTGWRRRGGERRAPDRAG